MCGAFSHTQTPRLLRDRRVHYRAKNCKLARKVGLRRMDNPGPLNLVRWSLNQTQQKAANQQSVGGVSHQMAYPCPWEPHITLTDQVTSLPAQRQDPLTTCYNPVDSYHRVLLWVARTNLVLQPPASMPRLRLGAPGLKLRLCLLLFRDLCGRVGGSKQQCPLHVRMTMLARQPRMGFVHQRIPMLTPLSWCRGG